MSFELPDDTTYSRRTLVATTLAVGVVPMTGCNEGSKDDNGESERDEGKPEEINRTKNELETVYRAINNLPIEEDGRFVFDVKGFEDDFDHKTLLERTRSIQDKLQEMKSGSADGQDYQPLIAISRVGELLVRERFLIHQVIAAGLTYRRKLSQHEYEDCRTAIHHGLEFLERLTENGQRIEDEIREGDTAPVTIDGFDSDSILDSQMLLSSIAHWSTTTYQAFNKAIQGFDLFNSGTEYLENDRLGEAIKCYNQANIKFAKAWNFLEETQGRGQQLPHIVPLVREFRCVIPIYRDTSDHFANALEVYRTGEEESSRKMANELITEVEQRISMCSDSQY